MPDALTALARLLATLHDDARRRRGRRAGRPRAAPTSTTRRTGSAHEAGLLDGVALIGTGRHHRPDLDQAGARRCSASTRRRTAEAPNALVPAAKAKLSVRLAPGDDPKHGVRGARGAPGEARAVGRAGRRSRSSTTAQPVRDRRDRPGVRRGPRRVPRRPGTAPTPVDIGVGGSIPFIATFQEMFPRRGDPGHRRRGPATPRAHGPNESLHLGEFARVCLAEALLLANVARAGRTAG